jgi:hypothetical protein
MVVVRSGRLKRDSADARSSRFACVS